jgi:hypothetical protein
MAIHVVPMPVKLMSNFAVFLLARLIPLAGASAQDLRACEFAAKARCVSGTARVTLAGGTVKRLEIDVIWCGLRGRPGHSCSIDVTRGDEESRWSDAAGATTIDNAAPFNPDEPDSVTGTRGRHISIDLEKAQSLGRCGAGAELPQAIVIPARGGACRVWLRPESGQ